MFDTLFICFFLGGRSFSTPYLFGGKDPGRAVSDTLFIWGDRVIDFKFRAPKIHKLFGLCCKIDFSDTRGAISRPSIYILGA